jgi:hypothetical protein
VPGSGSVTGSSSVAGSGSVGLVDWGLVDCGSVAATGF